jgi:hypothetical protein
MTLDIKAVYLCCALSSRPQNSGLDAQKRVTAERALAAVKSLINARTAAVFRLREARLEVFASATMDQHTIDLANAAWTAHGDSLRRGEMLYSPELRTDRRLPGAAERPPAALMIAPAFHEDELLALLYADSLEPYFCTRHDQMRLAELSTLVGKTLAASGAASPSDAEESWANYLDAADPVFSKQRDELLLLLNRTDWNIARVARILGVSRRTLYVRLEKYRIPREHVEKKGAGGRRTGRGTSETRTYPRFGTTFLVRTPAETVRSDTGAPSPAPRRPEEDDKPRSE